ncbi:MAG: tRNA uridine-5-carboxymethylaminomethyl(34) synthesis GTPase MnmE [Novosphingobium sp.]
MADTIFALSSGAPPAGVAVIRISGSDAGAALERIGGALPKSRRATLRKLRNPSDGCELDRALVLWMPGPSSATGEDCAELHLHGGRAVVAAIEAVLGQQAGLRRAEPGEFTRRAFANGRIDLAEAEGLADLLAAETELQRQAAMAMAGGVLSRQVNDWREQVLGLSAAIEATLDFSDEGEVGEDLPPGFSERCDELRAQIGAWLARPRAEPLREGLRVVLAGPPNAGKSTLFNALVEREAAITAPEAGTTRDVLTSSVSLDGLPFVFIDTAGLRDDEVGHVEAIGIERAIAEADRADLVLWLGDEGQGPDAACLWEISAQADRDELLAKIDPRHRISAISGGGMAALRDDLMAFARDALPRPGDAALNTRQHRLLEQVHASIASLFGVNDPILCAEGLRAARSALDLLVGRTGVEDMLDTLFGRFCIGK